MHANTALSTHPTTPPTRSIRPTSWMESILSLSLLLLGCSGAGEDGEDGAPCLKDTDCKGDRLCFAGMCTAPLDDPSAGSASVGGTSAGDPAEPCTKDSECKGDRVCVAGTCEDPGSDSGGDPDSSPCFELGGQIVCTQSDDPSAGMDGTLYGTVPPPPGPIPSSASLNLTGFSVSNQGPCGSCVAFAVRNAMGLRAIAQVHTFTDFSPAHIWHIAGYGSDDCDHGSSINTVVSANDSSDALTVPMSAWPYNLNDPEASLDAVPSPQVLAAEGIAHVDHFVAVSPKSVLELKYAILQGWPPVIGVPVYPQDWGDGHIDVYPEDFVPKSSHAVAIVGYDDATSTLRFANSWGTGFGEAGFGTMTYAFIEAVSKGGVAIQKLEYGAAPYCGDGKCEGGESQSDCCTDCGCPGGFGCEANICVEDSPCGNGKIDPGEECDGSALGGASCAGAGYDGGSVSCKADCTLNTTGCCDDECSGGGVCLDANTIGSCGNYDSDACLELGGGSSCPAGQTCSGGACGCAGGEVQITGPVYPSFGPSGCSGDGTLKLKASGEMISASTLRIHVRKADDTAFGSPATLSLYVGDGPTCPNPVNVVKATKAVVVGKVDQTIDLTVSPYGAPWSVGETKTFWVGKDEGGFASFRATGQVSVKRVCGT